MQTSLTVSSLASFSTGFLIKYIDKHNMPTGGSLSVDQIMGVSSGCSTGALECQDDNCSNAETITRTLQTGVPIYVNLGR